MQPGHTPAENYDAQLEEKVAKTKQQFEHLYAGNLEVFASPKKQFRMRAEFKIWHDKLSGKACYAMHEPNVRNSPIVIDTFEIGSQTIGALMPKVIARVNESPLLKHKLFQAEFLTTTKGEAVVSLIYHRALTDQWQLEAEALSNQLQCNVVGRSRKQKRIVGRDFVIEELEVVGRVFYYQQVETAFTQPNAAICAAMLNWACKNTHNCGGDLLELYCGNGNFTLPLSRNFNRVLATEVSKTSVKSALFNIAKNHIDNIQIARLSSEELTQAMNGVREFRRLKEIELEDYEFTTVFVDPPRAGLDDGTVELCSRFDTIVYISCNPTTLQYNLETLQASHSVTHMALFDQFPYTEHRECGVILHKR